MQIVTVCQFCGFNDNDPIIEFNFREGIIYTVCRECKKDNKISLKTEAKSLPKIKIRR